MTNVIVIHGYGATSESNWFQSLKMDLERDGIRTTVLDLPDSDDPVYSEWSSLLAKALDSATNETIVVAHSLGCISLLSVLSQEVLLNAKLKGIILVAGFLEPLPLLPELDPFIQQAKSAVDFESIQKYFERMKFIASYDDPIVPYALSKELSEQLEVSLISMDKGGHFLADDGYTSFPLLHDLIVAYDAPEIESKQDH